VSDVRRVPFFGNPVVIAIKLTIEFLFVSALLFFLVGPERPLLGIFLIILVGVFFYRGYLWSLKVAEQFSWPGLVEVTVAEEGEMVVEENKAEPDEEA
jgi:hypothetical protein